MSNSSRFTESVRTRFTPDEKLLIERWAEHDSRTLSQFLRVAALSYMKQLKAREALPELLDYMRKANMEVGDAVEISPSLKALIEDE